MFVADELQSGCGSTYLQELGSHPLRNFSSHIGYNNTDQSQYWPWSRCRWRIQVPKGDIASIRYEFPYADRVQATLLNPD